VTTVRFARPGVHPCARSHSATAASHSGDRIGDKMTTRRSVVGRSLCREGDRGLRHDRRHHFGDVALVCRRRPMTCLSPTYDVSPSSAALTVTHLS
jgi:hypothetical protein